MALARKAQEEDSSRRLQSAVCSSPATKKIIEICGRDARFRDWFLAFLSAPESRRNRKLRELLPEMKRRGISEADMWVMDSLGVAPIAKTILAEIEKTTDGGGQHASAT